jgi:hypothetical protein
VACSGRDRLSRPALRHRHRPRSCSAAPGPFETMAFPAVSDSAASSASWPGSARATLWPRRPAAGRPETSRSCSTSRTTRVVQDRRFEIAHSAPVSHRLERASQQAGIRNHFGDDVDERGQSADENDPEPVGFGSAPDEMQDCRGLQDEAPRIEQANHAHTSGPDYTRAFQPLRPASVMVVAAVFEREILHGAWGGWSVSARMMWRNPFDTSHAATYG